MENNDFLPCARFGGNSTDEEGDSYPGPKFGHLHVVFRDWNYSGTADEVSP